MLVLPLPCLDVARSQAERAYPRECCGLLVGRRLDPSTHRVTRIVPTENIAKRGHDRFEVDPQVRFDLMRQLGDGPECLVGHYHSHPDRSARPSKTDLAMALEPDLIWLIIPVSQGQAGRPAAFALSETGDRFSEILLKTTKE